MSSHVPSIVQEDFPPLCIFSAAPDNHLSQSGVAVYPVEDYMKMSGDCSGQYTDVYRRDQGPTNQSLTIRHICPLPVTALCSYTVGSGYRSCILDFPRGAAEKLKPAFS